MTAVVEAEVTIAERCRCCATAAAIDADAGVEALGLKAATPPIEVVAVWLRVMLGASRPCAARAACFCCWMSHWR